MDNLLANNWDRQARAIGGQPVGNYTEKEVKLLLDIGCYHIINPHPINGKYSVFRFEDKEVPVTSHV